MTKSLRHRVVSEGVLAKPPPTGSRQPPARGHDHFERFIAVLVATLWMLLPGAWPATGGSQPPNGGAKEPALLEPPSPAPASPRVLLLYGEPRLIRAVVDADAALRSTLDSQSPVLISYYTEYLDLNLFDGAMPLPGLREWLQRKYEARHLDLIVAGGSRALRIALQNRAALFSNAPVVFVSVDAAAAADLRLAADVTGTWLHIPWAETLETARQLQPEIRRVVVVTGSSPTDRVWTAAARQQLAPTAESIEVTYLSGHGIDEVLATVKSLTPSTVVLLGPFLRDATGRDFLAKDAARLIAAASSVPVYALFDTAVGTGVVGGHVVSFEAHGKTAGALALRVLAGQHPPPTDVGVTVPMFDTRQLTR